PTLGYLRVDGNVRLMRGTLHVAIDAVASDALAVEGDLWLGGALELEPIDGARRLSSDAETGARWTIATVRGEVHGAFASVPAGYRVEVSGQRVVVIRGAAMPDSDASAPLALRAH
ncbi:MAG TPA: hypothetical protein VMG12_25220, partial [Polyangiaceae bacterium]|nr:hypothetical protein [Polyangiaceae bacterium]